jgi:hypothetical protein
MGSNYQQRWVLIINRDGFQLSTEMGSNYQQRCVPIINRDGFQLSTEMGSNYQQRWVPINRFNPTTSVCLS